MKSWQQQFSIQKRQLESSAQVGTAMIVTLQVRFHRLSPLMLFPTMGCLSHRYLSIFHYYFL